MAKGYWLLNLDVINQVEYITFTEANRPFVESHSGRFLVRGGDFDPMEGLRRHRNVVVEFASYEEALGVYRSPEYQKVVDLRRPYAVADFVVVEGYGGTQPSAAPPPEGSAHLPRGYWMMRIDVEDEARAREYVAAAGEAFSAFGAWFLVRGGRAEQTEGRGRAGNVVVAFRDVVTARACYHSPAYQRAIAIRKDAAAVDLIIIAGYTGKETAAYAASGGAGG